MKENLKLGIILFVITALSGLCLGFVNELTAPAIAANSKISQSYLQELLPGTEKISDVTVENKDKADKLGVTEAFEAFKGSESLGYIMKVTSKGFHGPIDMLVAVSKEDKLTGIKVVDQKETPGLGARIGESKFSDKFKSKEIIKAITMVKTEAKNGNEVEAISGATISSKAVSSGINTAIGFYMKDIKGVEWNNKAEDAVSGASDSGTQSDSGNGDTDGVSAASEN